MVTRIRSRGQKHRHLYITEWMAYLGVSDAQLAGRLGVARETVTRWRNQQHRLNPGKIAAIAKALDREPEELWHPPPPDGRPSIDHMLRGMPDEAVQEAAEMVSILLRRRT